MRRLSTSSVLSLLAFYFEKYSWPIATDVIAPCGGWWCCFGQWTRSVSRLTSIGNRSPLACRVNIAFSFCFDWIKSAPQNAKSDHRKQLVRGVKLSAQDRLRNASERKYFYKETREWEGEKRRKRRARRGNYIRIERYTHRPIRCKVLRNSVSQRRSYDFFSCSLVSQHKGLDFKQLNSLAVGKH